MISIVIDIKRENRERECIRLIKMVGAEDVAMETKHGLIQLDYQTLVEAVVTMAREERRERNRWNFFGKLLNRNSV